MRKITDEEYKKSIEKTDVTSIDVYKGDSIKHLHECKRCHHRWMAFPTNVKRGSGCLLCFGTPKIAHKEYVKSIENLEVYSIGIYVSQQTKHLHGCKKCKHKWMVTPGNIKSGRGCVKCFENSRRISQSDYEESIKDSSVKSCGIYTLSGEKHLHECKKCHHRWMVKPTHIKRGVGCPLCFRNKTAYQRYKNIPTTLYLIDLPNNEVKPGLFQDSLSSRYGKNVDYTSIYEIYYSDGWDAWKHEQFILEETKNYQIYPYPYGQNGPLEGGNTEIRNSVCADVIIGYFEELKNNKGIK